MFDLVKRTNIMKPSKLTVALLFIILVCTNVLAQIQPGVYISNVENKTHELKISSHYFIHTVYEKSPAKFIKTLGGFYTTYQGNLKIKLEFNSNFAADSINSLSLAFEIGKDYLKLTGDSELSFKQQATRHQDLEGSWLFATRGPDKGQNRRGETDTRKTLKFLMDDRFQWVAYDTKDMTFKGTGGGNYSSKNGVYAENIEYFSRDNNRVGASLEFNYEIKRDDWHHTGKNSKGKPMYEIWKRR